MESASGFGAELRRLRKSAGLSLAGLSDRIHYSKGYLSKVENGRARPNPALAGRCDDALRTGGALASLMAALELTAPRRRNKTRPPSGLPRDTTNFQGRAAELGRISAVLGAEGPGEPGLVVVCVVSGMGGVGKTALAVRAAYRLRPSFPDGCLFIDLAGYAATAAVAPTDALDRLLRRIGVPPESIPAHPDDRAAAFRDCTDGKRLLLIFDNVRDVSQILPLLPAASGCRVLITSRNRLTALEDAHRVELEPLPLPDAMDLVQALVRASPSSMPADEPEIRRIALWCGRLPLAIRIASARFRANPWPDDPAFDNPALDGCGKRDEPGLAEFDDGERDLASVLEYSLRRLPPALRHAFALLGLHPGPDLDAEAAAALVGTSQPVARQQLRLLLDTNLLTAADRPGRYRFHDLLRSFARDRADAILPRAEQDEAVRRLTEYYWRALDSADRILTPHRYRAGMEPGESPTGRSWRSYADALAWATAEQDNLAATCRAAFAAGLDDRCWQIAFALRGFLFIAKEWDLWIETHDLAVAAASRAGDVRAEAATLNNLGLAHLERGDHDAAAALYDRARALFGRLGDNHGENTALAHHAWVWFHRGDFDQALRESLTALDFIQREGPPRNKAILLRDTALIEIELGQHRDAMLRLQEALAAFTALELHVDAAMALNCFGEAYHRLRMLDDAREAFLLAAERSRSSGSPFEEARAHDGLGIIAAEESDWERALLHWLLALARYTTLRDNRRGAQVRSRLAAVPPGS
jgi:tetratricopeptide (TPR) repeat protein/transcriptional regulator with XRE-family HTH domain